MRKAGHKSTKSLRHVAHLDQSSCPFPPAARLVSACIVVGESCRDMAISVMSFASGKLCVKEACRSLCDILEKERNHIALNDR